MSSVHQSTKALRHLEALLRSAPQGELDAVVVGERVREVLQWLSGEEAHWIGVTEAKRLLGVEWEKTVETWARLGLLRSQKLPNGHIQVLLDDVLYRRAESEDLLAIGGEDLSPEELRILYEERPGKNPWERGQAERPR